jgi:hypothetical protein
MIPMWVAAKFYCIFINPTLGKEDFAEIVLNIHVRVSSKLMDDD